MEGAKQVNKVKLWTRIISLVLLLGVAMPCLLVGHGMAQPYVDGGIIVRPSPFNVFTIAGAVLFLVIVAVSCSNGSSVEKKQGMMEKEARDIVAALKEGATR